MKCSPPDSFRAMRTAPRIILLSLALHLTLSLCPGKVLGQCVDYGDYVHWEADVETPGSARGVALSGKYAYVANSGTGGLHVVDISDPASPMATGSVDGPDNAYSVAVSGSHAYLATSGGLLVVDVSDPFSPQIVGSLDTPGSAKGVAVSGSHAYVASGYSLQVVDVSDPAAPVVVAALGTPGLAQGVAVLGSHAYVVGSSVDLDRSNLQVIDVSEPSSPWIVGGVNTPGEAQGVAVSGSHAYVADWDSGLQVVDVSDPVSPTIVGGVDTLGAAKGVAVSGSYAYVAAGSFQVVDVSDPTSPEPVAWLQLSDSLRGVAVSGSHAYVAAGGLQIVDVSRPVSPPLAVGWISTPDEAWDVAVSGSHAYIACAGSGLQVVDVSDPASPEIVAEVESYGYARSVAVSGNYVYVAGSFGLLVVNVSDPASPTTAGWVFFGGGYWDGTGGVVVSGDYAYVGGGQYSGVQVVSIEFPYHPVIVAGMGGESRGLAVSGSHAYVAAGDAGLRVFDVSDPTSPVLVGSLDTPGSARRVAVSGSHAYVADRLSGLQVVDVSDPASPSIVASVDQPGAAQGVTLSGSYAYVGGWVQVVDISAPTTPVIVGSPRAYGSRHAVSGGYLYDVGQPGWALQIVPAQCEMGPVPVLLSGFTAEARDQNVLLSWFTSFEYLHEGFNVYRSSLLGSGYTRLNERLIRGRSPYSYLDAAVHPSTSYYYKLGAVDSRGQEILHPPTSVTTPAWGIRTALSVARPSPFRKETLITFTLAAPVDVKLAVHDVTGRLVRGLAGEELREGDHSVSWDGRDDAGLRVAGGAYFVKLTAGEVTQTRKVVFLGGK